MKSPILLSTLAFSGFTLVQPPVFRFTGLYEASFTIYFRQNAYVPAKLQTTISWQDAAVISEEFGNPMDVTSSETLAWA